jgi:kinesin family member 6/9
LFQEIQSRYEQSIVVRVSYLEIYNELMGDLLALSLNPEMSSNLAVQEDPRGGVHVKGLLTKICTNEEEALSMFFEGETNRTITEHKLNKVSSRSHCIFTIHLEMRSRVESSEKVLFAKLNLVDLAGSERTKKTGLLMNKKIE